MSEAQQGPEFRDVISAKRYHFLFYFLDTQSEPLWGKREVFDWAKSFFQTYPCDRILFSIFLWCM